MLDAKVMNLFYITDSGAAHPVSGPGGKPVWRSICIYGARELLCYCDTSSLLIADSFV
jgi:hypothetical protein